MAFLSVKEAVSTKVSAFIAVVTRDGVCFAYKSKCTLSKAFLSKTLDTRMHRLEIRGRSSMPAWDEFERIALEDGEVASVLGGSGYENNKKFVYLSNIKRMEHIFGMSSDDIQSLAVGVRNMNPVKKRLAVIGAIVRTNNEVRFPGLLLLRSWDGRVPGEQIRSVTPKTRADTATTPICSVSVAEKKAGSYPRNLCLDDVAVGAYESAWNAIYVTCLMRNDGTIESILQIPFVSFGDGHDANEIRKIVKDAYAALPDY